MFAFKYSLMLLNLQHHVKEHTDNYKLQQLLRVSALFKTTFQPVAEVVKKYMCMKLNTEATCLFLSSL